MTSPMDTHEGLLLRRLADAQRDCMIQGEAAAAILLRDARTAIVRLLALTDLAQASWQPIETAPKDGRAFLACTGNWMTVCHWHRHQKCWATNGPAYSAYPRDEQPTHWRPLPAGPSVTSTQRCDRCGSSGDVFMLCAGCHSPIPSSSLPARGAEDEERELFDAATKIDLAGALRHLRDWMSHIDNHHREKYAGLIEAQAKLIAWLSALRSPAPHAEVREALEFYADPSAWKKKHDPEDVVRVPDFYSETSFGDTAQTALAALAPHSLERGEVG